MSAPTRARPAAVPTTATTFALDVVECVVCLRRYGRFVPDAGVVVHGEDGARTYVCRLPGVSSGPIR